MSDPQKKSTQIPITHVSWLNEAFVLRQQRDALKQSMINVLSVDEERAKWEHLKQEQVNARQAWVKQINQWFKAPVFDEEGWRQTGQLECMKAMREEIRLWTRCNNFLSNSHRSPHLIQELSVLQEAQASFLQELWDRWEEWGVVQQEKALILLLTFSDFCVFNHAYEDSNHPSKQTWLDDSEMDELSLPSAQLDREEVYCSVELENRQKAAQGLPLTELPALDEMETIEDFPWSVSQTLERSALVVRRVSSLRSTSNEAIQAFIQENTHPDFLKHLGLHLQRWPLEEQGFRAFKIMEHYFNGLTRENSQEDAFPWVLALFSGLSLDRQRAQVIEKWGNILLNQGRFDLISKESWAYQWFEAILDHDFKHRLYGPSLDERSPLLDWTNGLFGRGKIHSLNIEVKETELPMPTISAKCFLEVMRHEQVQKALEEQWHSSFNFVESVKTIAHQTQDHPAVIEWLASRPLFEKTLLEWVKNYSQPTLTSQLANQWDFCGGPRQMSSWGLWPMALQDRWISRWKNEDMDSLLTWIKSLDNPRVLGKNFKEKLGLNLISILWSQVQLPLSEKEKEVCETAWSMFEEVLEGADKVRLQAQWLTMQFHEAPLNASTELRSKPRL